MIYQVPETIAERPPSQLGLQIMTWQRDESHATLKARNSGQNAAAGAGTARRPRQRSAVQVGVERPLRVQPISDHRDHEGYLIKELQHRLRHRIEARIRAKGLWLSFPHSAVLMILNEEPGLSGAQLARRNSVTAQTMNGLLLPLEKKGLIERRADPENARVLQCFLKPKGVQVLQEGMHEAAAVFNQMLGKLSAREREEFRRILHRCLDALQSNGHDAESVERPAAKRKSKT
jgi:DNA-binding MarR family transcriptional regulator